MIRVVSEQSQSIISCVSVLKQQLKLRLTDHINHVHFSEAPAKLRGWHLLVLLVDHMHSSDEAASSKHEIM